MKRLTMAGPLCALALCVFAPAAAAEQTPKPNHEAAKLCAAEKHADKAAFEAKYGKHAMRECKRANRAELSAAIDNAVQECRAEQAADPEGFADTYGTNANGHNSFGKCVSAKVAQHSAEETETFANASQACRAERDADPDAFAQTYGTNGNGKNAFGKCVSQRMHEEETAPPAV